MLDAYFSVLVFIAIGAAVGIAMMSAGYLLGRSRPDPAKNAPYECGFDALEDARVPFDVRYYLVAILFILFDLETAFLFPWAAAFHKIGWHGFLGMMFFLALLVVGFIFEWRKGALEWS